MPDRSIALASVLPYGCSPLGYGQPHRLQVRPAGASKSGTWPRTLFVLGVFTFVGLVELGIEDFLLGRAINRIRHYYLEHAGDTAPAP